MVRLATIGAAAVLAGSVAAQLTKDCGGALGKCPSHKPCCSQYGQCGIGAYCLGGCDPLNSFKIQSCVAAPQCQSKTYKFTDSKSSPILPNTKYLGDPSKADWVSDGQPLFANGVVYLTMAPDTVGTVLASTRYVWYGKISATMRTSIGKGVVSAFITMSDVKDEIDYEWVGVDLHTSQTNYYWNGIPDYTNSQNITMEGNTYSEWHTYTIDWTPDSITWSVDGQVGRVSKREDTYNKTTGHWEFPQTPSRVLLSLWPGGLATNGKGTIDWAGGLIDWDADEVKKHGYFFAMVKEVKIECYDPPAGTKGNGKTSYQWLDGKAVNTSVELSDDSTILKSFLGSGTDMDKELPNKVSSVVVSTDASGKATTVTQVSEPTDSSVGTVPGLDGAGWDSGDLHNDDGSGDGGSGDGGDNGGTTRDPTQTGWTQDNGSGAGSDATRLLTSGLLWANFIAMLMVAGGMTLL